MEQQLINKIDKAFLLSQIRYEEIKNKLKASDAFDFVQERHDYFNNPTPSTQVLLGQIFNWRNKRSLKYEMDSNAGIINNYRQAYGLFLSRQYALISTFNKAIDIYFNNAELTNHLINALQSDDGEKLNKADFILAIELYYITVFELVEDSIHRYDPEHKKKLDSQYHFQHQDNLWIKLDYDSKNDQIIEDLYKVLEGKQITCTLEEFQTLFRPGGHKQKGIVWQGTEPQLLLLFVGNPLDVIGLKTKNDNILRVVSGILLNKKLMPFKRSQLGVVEQKSTKIQGAKSIINFLTRINS
ncbi:hypothetical protein HDF26_003597 [Pedobacter cryoconitis]|uniref:hypothetical protein n=1 Tax=Pedobacter cryoconitis TaxID=188932 RepID=UPI001618F559|nr:hypothetical protein [Pedobacter cryoconitis]MBB6273137.1 hypothetical protein [Pedobacter cryoconitis]